MRANCLWAALAVPMVFNRVRNASGSFIAASRAVAALVFGVALCVVPGCCRLTVRVFRCCAGWLFATGVVDVAGGVCDLVCRVLSSCFVSGTLGSVASVCTLETVAFLFYLCTLGSVPCIDVASTVV